MAQRHSGDGGPAVLTRLAELIRRDGGLLAEALRDEDGWAAVPTPFGDAVARAPRADHHGADLPLVIEAVREGYLLHYGAPRLLSRDDDDLALLAGDRLYALALERLAAAGDLAAVSALSDLIALSAQAQAAGDEELAGAVWAAGCAELGWGSTPDLETAKGAARAGKSGAAQRLEAAARHIAPDVAPAR